jgi:phosphate transport system permease protein
MMKRWFASGTPWIWLNAAAVSVSLIMVVGLLALIAVRGLGHFWPGTVHEYEYGLPDRDPARILGEVANVQQRSAQVFRDAGLPLPDDVEFAERILIKQGNRDLTGRDFVWYVEPFLSAHRTPEDVVVLERREWGNFYGYLRAARRARRAGPRPPPPPRRRGRGRPRSRRSRSTSAADASRHGRST